MKLLSENIQYTNNNILKFRLDNKITKINFVPIKESINIKYIYIDINY